MVVKFVLILREISWGNLMLISGGQPRGKFYVNIGRKYGSNLMLTLERQQWGNYHVNTISTVEEGYIGRVALRQNYTVNVKAGSQASSAMQNLTN
jgi:hypothetical protein